MNRPVTGKEIELTIKNQPIRKSPVCLASLVNSTKHLRTNTDPLQTPQKIKMGERLLNLFSVILRLTVSHPYPDIKAR